MIGNSNRQEGYTWEIRGESSWLSWRLKELWQYRHLLMRIVRRDFLIHHQQTLLGPLWILFQPVILLVMYVLIFEKAVGLSTDGVSPVLFYLSGIIIYNLFAESFSATALTFVQNGTLFSKVYFPRLIIPLSSIMGNLVRFAIQLAVFLICMVAIAPGSLVQYPHRWITALLMSVTTSASLGLGLGLVFSILTAKYRDLVNVIHLIVRLLMFATPIIYPISMVNANLRWWIFLNPLSSQVELFRYGFLGQGTFEMIHLVYSMMFAVVLIVLGTMLFNKFGSKLQDVI